MAYDKVVDSTQLDADLTAIADAIRSKTGETATMALADMPNKISGISTGAETETYTFDQRRTEVANYINNVTYDPSDYTTSQIASYVTTTSANYPIGIAINLKSAGTLTIVDGYTGRTLTKAVSAGYYSVYNCTPNAESKFVLVNASGEIVQNGIIKPTGAERMICIPNVDNVRDLGGWACDGGIVKYGMLFRGGEVYNHLTDDSKQMCLDFLGIEKELNLVFTTDLGGRTVSGFGNTVDMLHVDMTWNALSWQKENGNIKAIFDPLFDFIIADKPTYFHCSAGADRTGVVALICEAVLGVSQSDMDKDYELTCFYTGADTDENARRRNETIWTREIDYINTFSGDTFRDRTVNLLLQCGITIDKINAFRAACIDGTPETLTASVSTFSVTNTLTDVTNSNSATTATQYQPYTANIAPTADKVIDSIKVTMGGVDVTSQVFSGTTDVLRRSITQTLTACESSNTRAYVIDGQSYVTTLTAITGYAMDSVTITMGGVDVSTFYKDGIISIPEVTGDIVITATAVTQAPAYTNQLENAIDLNGNVIGKAWMATNSRYNSSSGDPVTLSGYNITGLIPYKYGDTIRIRWSGSTDGTYQSVKGFGSSRTQISTGYLSFTNIWKDGSTQATVTRVDAANGILDFVITNSVYANVSYLAIVLQETDINNVIITVNEEIT